MTSFLGKSLANGGLLAKSHALAQLRETVVRSLPGEWICCRGTIRLPRQRHFVYALLVCSRALAG